MLIEFTNFSVLQELLLWLSLNKKPEAPKTQIHISNYASDSIEVNNHFKELKKRMLGMKIPKFETLKITTGSNKMIIKEIHFPNSSTIGEVFEIE